MNQTPGIGQAPPFDSEDEESASPRRMYLHEPGWGISIKTGSHREFCYTMAPGQDFYHRLSDGEVFLFRGDERLCLSCAARRGIIVSAPKRLRDKVVSVPVDSEAIPLELDWRDARRTHG